MTAAFIEFEDVLVRGDRSPIPLGLTLVKALQPAFRLALSIKDTKPELAKHWLLENGFPKGAISYQHHRGPTEASMSDDELFSLHLDAVLVDIAVEFVVTASPARAALAMQRSITALLFGSPATARPEFRPGKTVKAWQDIEAEISRRSILTTSAITGED